MELENVEKIYDKQFYTQAEGSYKSAIHTIAFIRNVLQPTSVIDIGCGVGTWLRAWSEFDSSIKVFGIDGNNMEDSMFFIPKDNYKQVNLTDNYKTILENLTKDKRFSEILSAGGGGDFPKEPIKNPNKPFDLVQSLEVAEHFEEKYAQNFINLLTSLSNIVLFSAAIPLQGGTHHVNEQPPAYWASLFASNDYVCYDFIRHNIWNNVNIEFWYRQNILLFAHKDIKIANLMPVGTPNFLLAPEMYYRHFVKS